jgi:hypothetical protein
MQPASEYVLRTEKSKETWKEFKATVPSDGYGAVEFRGERPVFLETTCGLSAEETSLAVGTTTRMNCNIGYSL